MNAQTPIQVSAERSILELLADPELLKARAAELLEATRQAETVQQKAIAAKIEADQAMRAAAEELTKAREVQHINTRKSQVLSELQDKLAEREKALEAEHADRKKRLAEWEDRLKAQADAQATMQAEIDRQVNEVAAGRAKLTQDLADAEAIFAKAQSIKEAMGA